jgi:hypothetical protein
MNEHNQPNPFAYEQLQPVDMNFDGTEIVDPNEGLSSENLQDAAMSESPDSEAIAGNATWGRRALRPALQATEEILRRAGVRMDDLLTEKQRSYVEQIRDTSRTYQDIGDELGAPSSYISAMGNRSMNKIHRELVKRGLEDLADQLPKPAVAPVRPALHSIEPDETTSRGLALAIVQEGNVDVHKLAERLDTTYLSLQRVLTGQRFFKSPVMMQALLNDPEVGASPEVASIIYRMYIADYRAQLAETKQKLLKAREQKNT